LTVFLEKETRYPDTKSEIIENDLKSYVTF